MRESFIFSSVFVAKTVLIKIKQTKQKRNARIFTEDPRRSPRK